MPWALLGLGCLASFLAWRWEEQRYEEHRKAALEQRAGQLARELSDSLSHYSLILRGGAALFAGSAAVERNEWFNFAQQWELGSPSTRVEAIAYTPMVPAGQRDRFTSEVRGTGSPAYTIYPESQGTDSSPILFIEPFTPGNQTALGFDLRSAPESRAAADQARDTGQPAASESLALPVRRPGTSPIGFLVCVPVYRPGTPALTVEQRRQACAGLVVGIFRTGDWVQSVLKETAADADLHVTLRDRTNGIPIFGPTSVDAGARAKAGLPEFSVRVAIPGREMFLSVEPTPLFSGEVDPSTAWLVLSTGLALSVLLFGLVQFNVVTRSRARGLAEQMTRDLRRARGELERSTQQLRGLLDAVPDLVFRVNGSGTIVDYHPASRGTLDTPLESFLNRGIRDILPEPTASEVLAAAQRALATQKLTMIEYPVTGRTGTRVIEARFQPISGSEAICLARDITARKQTEAALQQNEQRLRTIVESIEQVFWVADPGRLQARYISPAVQRIWGYPPERFLAEPNFVLETVHPEDRDLFLRAVTEQAAGRRTSIEYRVFHADGSIRWVWDQGFPVVGPAGALVAVNGLATNITERKQLESRLRQGQKMEAIGTLAGGIAHDFNNILGSIIGFTELARLDARGQPEVVQSLNDVLRASRRAKGLVRQILAFSRQQEADRSAMAIGPVVEEAVRLLRAAATSSIQFVVEVPPDLPLIHADPTQLHQILMNLGTNAIQAIRPGHGTLQIRLETVVIDAAFAGAHPGIDPGSHVRLSVRDSGSGIEPEILDKIFDPFFTTKPPGEGSGLGLSVVHGIVKSYRGLITVESQPGTGSVFQVYLPAAENLPMESEVVPGSFGAVSPGIPSSRLKPGPKELREPDPGNTGSGQHVLFVDDEPTLGIVGKRVLERCGYRVTVKQDPIEALEIFRRDPDQYDLVITDLTMPSMDGTGLAARIRELRPAMPILLTTGFGGDMTPDMARSLGMRDLLFKPNDLESLGDAVQRALSCR